MSRLLRLLSGATDTFRSVIFSSTATYHYAVLEKAMMRAIDTDVSRVFIPAPKLPKEGNSHGEQGTSFRWLVWWQQPTFWRDEVQRPDGSKALNIVTPSDSAALLVPLGNTWSSRLPSFLRRTPSLPFSKPRLEDRLRSMPMAAPLALTSGWLLSDLGNVHYLGRPAVLAEALRVNGAQAFLMSEADSLHLTVDLERGIVLRCAAMIGSAVAATFDMQDVHFDEDIPLSVFSL